MWHVKLNKFKIPRSQNNVLSEFFSEHISVFYRFCNVFFNALINGPEIVQQQMWSMGVFDRGRNPRVIFILSKEKRVLGVVLNPKVFDSSWGCVWGTVAPKITTSREEGKGAMWLFKESCLKLHCFRNNWIDYNSWKVYESELWAISGREHPPALVKGSDPCR